MVAYWEPGTQYNYGSIVEYEGHKYKIIQPHFSEADWTPPATPALWGRLSDEDDHATYQPQPPPAQQQSSYQYGGGQECESTPLHPDQSAEIHHEEREKHWYDLEEDRKKKLEIGGGLLAGAALIGAGYYAFHEHGKSEENKKALTWQLQNWLRDAQDRTNRFKRDGPQGPTTWVLNEGKSIPPGALVGGHENGQPLYIARAFHEGGIQVGKASSRFGKGAVIGFKHKEIEVGTYEILLGDPRAVRWIDAHGKFRPGNLQGLRPVEGGREDDGSLLFIAQAEHHGGLHPGKCSERLDGAYITYGGDEKEEKRYRVLCYA
ncbi:carbohydrate-binding module family 12 protein [Dentipellis sp. KUC8613]|nr:carbohydrate-binding module family 12 protein [Dentipellis sp. KUC8613]